MSVVRSQFLLTAGGRICCVRCGAMSKRTGLQCARPALKISRTGKCQFHGGRGSGPATAEGRARIALANTKHGFEGRAARRERSLRSAELSHLEDLARISGLITGPRLPGRRANGYVPIRSMAEAQEYFRRQHLHYVQGVLDKGSD